MKSKAILFVVYLLPYLVLSQRLLKSPNSPSNDPAEERQKVQQFPTTPDPTACNSASPSSSSSSSLSMSGTLHATSNTNNRQPPDCERCQSSSCGQGLPDQNITINNYLNSTSSAISSSSTPESSYFNNIDFLTLGYDILQGYPLTQKGLDPGFKTTRIFNLSNTLDTTADKRFFIPEGTSVVKELSCELSFDSQQVSSEESLQNLLKLQASASGSGWGASFKASSEYQGLQKDFKSSNDLHVISKGECQVYRAWLNTHEPPHLTTYFINDVKKTLLPYALTGGSPNFANELDFIRIYGTHFVQSMSLGAKLSIIKSVNVQKGQTFGDKSVSLSAAASYSSVYSVAGEFTYEHQTQAATAFEEQVTSTKTSTIGSRPPVDGDVNTWAQQSFVDPMPLTYSLQNISDLFQPLFLREEDIMDSLPSGANIAQYYEGLQSNIENALTTYCQSVDNCEQGDPEDYSSQFRIITSRTPTNGYDRDTYGETFTNGYYRSKTQKIQMRVRSSDNVLEAIRVFISNTFEDNTEPTWLGNPKSDGQTQLEFIVPPYHTITKFDFWTALVGGNDYVITGVRFIFEDGQISRVFGAASFADSIIYQSPPIVGVLSGFHGYFNSEYLFSLGAISFDFLTPLERTKKVMYATPLFGKSWPCGDPFYEYQPVNSLGIHFLSSQYVEGIGIKYQDVPQILWKYGKNDPTHNQIGPIIQFNTYDLTVFSDGNDNDWVEGIRFNGGIIVGSATGNSKEPWNINLLNMVDSEADKYLSLDGVYGRADNDGICSIGFIYTRTYTLD